MRASCRKASSRSCGSAVAAALGVGEPHHLLEGLGGAAVVLLGVLDQPVHEAGLGEEVALVGRRGVAGLRVAGARLLAHQRAEPQRLGPGGLRLPGAAGVRQGPPALELVLRQEEVEPVLVAGREGLAGMASDPGEERLLVLQPRADREEPLHGRPVEPGALRAAVEHLVEGGERGVVQPQLEERLAELVAGLVVRGGQLRVAEDLVERQRRRLVGPLLQQPLGGVEPVLGHAGGHLPELEPERLRLGGRGRALARRGGRRRDRRGRLQRRQLGRSLGRRARGRRCRGGRRRRLARERLGGGRLLGPLLHRLLRLLLLGRGEVEPQLRLRRRTGREGQEDAQQPGGPPHGGVLPAGGGMVRAGHGHHCTGRFCVGKKNDTPSSVKSWFCRSRLAPPPSCQLGTDTRYR